jgi:hypothetical protein
LANIDTVVVAYLARGADERCFEKFDNFVNSYKMYKPGIEHQLCVIFKGFCNGDQLRDGTNRFASLSFSAIHTSDLTFDIGAYFDAAKQVDAGKICFINTNTEISSHNWLAKLSNNLDLEDVGMVGATGSFESLKQLDQRMPPFPNVHLRSNAFMMRRRQLVEILSTYSIRTKVDAYLVESGRASITRRIFEMGLSVRIVGRDGRGYHPESWPQSFTFRQGDQSNLLVKDNHTRNFDKLTFPAKKEISLKTWGNYISSGVARLIPDESF